MDPEALTRALDESLGIRVVVEKARRLVVWRGARIHLDAVAGLGTFVELEAVSDRVGGLPEQEARIDELRGTLGITDDRLVARGYADLLERLPGLRLAR
jgi:adenylate cyclase, class 2